MGLCCGKAENVSKPEANKDPDNSPKKEIHSKGEFALGVLDMVPENKNKVSKEYNVLSPPLGRGAFGEVRQAIHRETGLIRAIKIVFKESSKPEDLARIVKEVIADFCENLQYRLKFSRT